MRTPLFLAVAIALVAAPALGGDRRCGALPTLRSVDGDTASVMTFVNTSGAERRIVWIDYDGGQVLYATLSPGRSVAQPTFATHPWLVTDAAGNCTEIFVATAMSRTVELE